MDLVRDILRNPALDFSVTCLQTFHRQAAGNPVYKAWLKGIGVDIKSVKRLEDIPFLPIELFKSHAIKTGDFDPELTFRSSGTTGLRSAHHLASASDYRTVSLEGFRLAYGSPEKYRILSLLPSYHESGDSSLVFMCEYLMKQSGHHENGFYHDRQELLLKLLESGSDRPTLLIGVAYALLDLATHVKKRPTGLIVVETGGMKGRRREMIREELHDKLNSSFGTDRIHSEYGMTELLSQAWSDGSGLFRPPPWLRILTADPEDPLSLLPADRTGLIQIMDLANQHSCSFIGTKDLGRVLPDGSFEVLGRADNSDIRGCNLLIA